MKHAYVHVVSLDISAEGVRGGMGSLHLIVDTSLFVGERRRDAGSMSDIVEPSFLFISDLEWDLIAHRSPERFPKSATPFLGGRNDGISGVERPHHLSPILNQRVSFRRSMTDLISTEIDEEIVRRLTSDTYSSARRYIL
jgi:hypothetical protein